MTCPNCNTELQNPVSSVEPCLDGTFEAAAWCPICGTLVRVYDAATYEAAENTAIDFFRRLCNAQ